MIEDTLYFGIWILYFQGATFFDLAVYALHRNVKLLVNTFINTLLFTNRSKQITKLLNAMHIDINQHRTTFCYETKDYGAVKDSLHSSIFL